jgi:hypothetical protein
LHEDLPLLPSMKRFSVFGFVFVACFPICFFLASHITTQLSAMGVAQVGEKEALQWSLLISLGVSLTAFWRKTRKQRKAKAYAVNCFSRHFRA